jgi:DNA helicase-2/ATP-dependent DNA helicase PcrA
MVEAFGEAGVEYQLWGARGVADSDAGRTVLSLLRVICDEDDYVAFRILLGQLTQVGTTTCNQIARLTVANNLNYKDLFFQASPSGVFNARQSSALARAREIVAELSEWAPEDTIGSRREALTELLSREYIDDALAAWESLFETLPDDATLQEARDYLWSESDETAEAVILAAAERAGREVTLPALPPKVRMMTMHGAKGLDASVVLIPGLEDELLPGNKRAPYPGLVLEAARLLYVSMTRAKASCVLSWSRSRFAYGRRQANTPSRFLQATGGSFANRSTPMIEGEASQIAEEIGAR